MKKSIQFKIKHVHLLFFAIVSVIGIAISTESCSGNKESGDNSAMAAASAEKANAQSYADLGAIDEVLYEKGKEIFNSKCTHCHTLDKKIKGPALRGVTKRHSVKWVNGLLTSLQKLSEADSIIKHVLEVNNDEYIDPNPKPIIIPLTTEEERRAVIEFLRKEG